MSDMATVRQAVIEGWKLDASGAADELVNRAICQALRALRPMVFTFNTSTFTLDTLADQISYAKATKGGATDNLLPWDFWGVVGQQVRLDHEKGGTPLSYSKLTEVDPADLDRRRWETNQSGLPDRYTVNDETLWINPPPDSIDELSGRYLKDLETPVPKYAASAWTYIGADAAAINSSTFTNAWFTRGYDVLTARTAMKYFSEFERNKSNQQSAEVAYGVALAELRREAAPLITMGQIRPFLGSNP